MNTINQHVKKVALKMREILTHMVKMSESIKDAASSLARDRGRMYKTALAVFVGMLLGSTLSGPAILARECGFH
jgi:hypothetical protein